MFFRELTKTIKNIERSEGRSHRTSIIIGDLQKAVDEKRKIVMGSKIKTYPFLEMSPNPKNDDTYLNIVGINIRDNDEIDDIILYSTYKDAVDFLITEDRGIHKKASKLGIIDRVLPSMKHFSFLRIIYLQNAQLLLLL